MKTKPMTFDAVAASRKWREETGRLLDAMSIEERLAFLDSLRLRKAATAKAPSSCAVREASIDYRTKTDPKS